MRGWLIPMGNGFVDPATSKHSLDLLTSTLKIEKIEKIEDMEDQGSGSTGGSWKSAVEVSNAGVKFCGKSLGKIEFNDGVLYLPHILITHRTEKRLLNAIAYEMRRGGDAMVTDYVIIMANLLKTPKDVKVLSSAWIISNELGNHQEVVDLFNNISHVASSGRYANNLQDTLNKYCESKWRSLRAYVIGTYFRSPWAMFSLVYAIILFLFTVGQTYYTVAAYYSSDDGTSPK